MKNFIITFLFTGFLCGVLCQTVFADTKLAERQTTLNNVTDFMATVGKDPQDKKEILQERHEIRKMARLKEQERRKNAATRKRMRQQEAAMMEKINAPLAANP